MDESIDIDFYEYEGYGYHGHIREVIDETLEDNEFNKSTKLDNFLGKGIYFFEEDLQLTIRWCEKARNYDDWGIIKAFISSDKAIDLNKSAHFHAIENLFKKIIRKYENIDGDKYIPRAKLFDILHEIKSFDMMRGTKRVPYGDEAKKLPGRIPFYHVQVILCVRNPDCIEILEEVKIDEH